MNGKVPALVANGQLTQGVTSHDQVMSHLGGDRFGNQTGWERIRTQCPIAPHHVLQRGQEPFGDGMPTVLPVAIR